MKSRFDSFLDVGIDLPTDDLIRVILVKSFSDKQINVSIRLLEYILINIDRSYEKIFQFVKEVVEYLAGEDLDMQKAVEAHASRLEQKGAAMIKKYNCNGNPLMLGLYQLLAEGRAARNWAMMAKVIQDPFISSRYAKIAKDESFHATLGRMELEKLCDTQEAQDEINAVINNFRKDLFAITSSKTGTLEESAKLMEVYA